MTRSEIQEKYKWSLEDIYSSDDKWKEDYETAKSKLNFSRYAGKMGDRAQLKAFLDENSEYCKILDKLVAYAHLKQDEDRSVTEYNAMYSLVYSLYTQYATETAFYEPELSKLSDEYLNSLIDDELTTNCFRSTTIISSGLLTVKSTPCPKPRKNLSVRRTRCLTISAKFSG